MSGLWDRWHELSKRGGLDLAGCQMLADWKKEADGLHRELQYANQAVEKLQERLQQAEEKIKSKQSMLDSLYANTERLWKWARETLTGEIADQFWQISANGHLMHENPEYHQRINCLKHEVEEFKEFINSDLKNYRIAVRKIIDAAIRVIKYRGYEEYMNLNQAVESYNQEYGGDADAG